MRLERELGSLIALVTNVTEAYTAALFLENKARSGYQLMTYHSLSRHIIPNAFILPGQGLVGWVLQNRQPLSVDQFRYETSSLGFYSQEEEIKSFMAVPVLSGKVDGALAIDSKKRYVFTPKVQKILMGFSEQFANLLESALEFSSTQRERVPVGALQSYLSSLSAAKDLSSLCNAICLIPRELLSFDGCFLVLRDEDGKRFHLVRTGGLGELFLQERVVTEKGSLTGWIVSNGRPLRLNDARGASRKTFLFHPNEPRINFRSFLGVPLSWDGTVFGALGFCTGRPRSFDEADQQMAELLALQVSHVLSRAFIARRWDNLAIVDPVTGTYNFRYFKRQLRLAVEHTLENGGSLSILAVGIDNLPQLNEIYGYKVGDELLREMARLLSRFAGERDVVVRYGGDRFLLSLGGVGDTHAPFVARRIMETLEDTVFLPHHQELSLSLSIGIATFPHDGRTKRELIDRALDALERARGRGSNQICVFEEIGAHDR